MGRSEWVATILLAAALVAVLLVIFGEVTCTGTSAQGPFTDCVWRWK
jgi:hypothetical protein